MFRKYDFQSTSFLSQKLSTTHQAFFLERKCHKSNLPRRFIFTSYVTDTQVSRNKCEVLQRRNLLFCPLVLAAKHSPYRQLSLSAFKIGLSLFLRNVWGWEKEERNGKLGEGGKVSSLSTSLFNFFAEPTWMTFVLNIAERWIQGISVPRSARLAVVEYWRDIYGFDASVVSL